MSGTKFGGPYPLKSAYARDWTLRRYTNKIEWVLNVKFHNNIKRFEVCQVFWRSLSIALCFWCYTVGLCGPVSVPGRQPVLGLRNRSRRLRLTWTRTTTPAATSSRVQLWRVPASSMVSADIVHLQRLSACHSTERYNRFHFINVKQRWTKCFNAKNVEILKNTFKA